MTATIRSGPAVERFNLDVRISELESELRSQSARMRTMERIIESYREENEILKVQLAVALNKATLVKRQADNTDASKRGKEQWC